MNAQVRIETYERLQELLRAKAATSENADERAVYEYILENVIPDELEFWNERSSL
jgi:hypothetical protein